MYTMHDDDQRVFDALKAGADGYLLKSSPLRTRSSTAIV
jgi:DNA-binding NarL/FixJ family response regulator